MSAYGESNIIGPVEDGLWKMLESSEQFVRLVPTRNRIKYGLDEAADPERETMGTGPSGFPRVRIVPTNCPTETEATFASATVDHAFGIVLESGDARTWKVLYPVCEAIYRVMLGARGRDPMPGVSFVRYLRFTPGWSYRMHPGDADAPKGWVAVLTVSALIFLDRDQQL